MNTIKKLMLLLLALTALTACNDKELPVGAEFFENLMPSPTEGIYEGKILYSRSDDNIGVWCEITSHPDDVNVDSESIAPNKGSWIYVSLRVFNGNLPESGTTIKFQIMGIGGWPPEGFPYLYLLYTNRCYYICDIRLVE